MKSYDIVGWIDDGGVVCTECVNPSETEILSPIFASDEGWEDYI